MKSSGRKALHPRNIFNIPSEDTQELILKKAKEEDTQEFILKKKKKTKEEAAAAAPASDKVKVVQSIDASLAEELSAFKKKLERLREERERTENLLEERDGAMALHMKHLLHRWEIQKSLEVQVDRLFRLKELHAYSSKISPIRSLRAKEQEKRKSFS